MFVKRTYFLLVTMMGFTAIANSETGHSGKAREEAPERPGGYRTFTVENYSKHRVALHISDALLTKDQAEKFCEARGFVLAGSEQLKQCHPWAILKAEKQEGFYNLENFNQDTRYWLMDERVDDPYRNLATYRKSSYQGEHLFSRDKKTLERASSAFHSSEALYIQIKPTMMNSLIHASEKTKDGESQETARAVCLTGHLVSSERVGTEPRTISDEDLKAVNKKLETGFEELKKLQEKLMERIERSERQEIKKEK